MLHFLKYWFPPIFMMGLIFLISTDLGSSAHTSSIIEPILRYLFPKISNETMEQVHHYFRKGGHLTGYAILGILWWRALMHRQAAKVNRSPGANAALALVIAAAYAGTDEYHQSFIPTRTASIHDVMIDTCGALVGLALALTWHAWRSQARRGAK